MTYTAYIKLYLHRQSILTLNYGRRAIPGYHICFQDIQLVYSNCPIIQAMQSKTPVTRHAASSFPYKMKMK